MGNSRSMCNYVDTQTAKLTFSIYTIENTWNKSQNVSHFLSCRMWGIDLITDTVHCKNKIVIK